MLVDNSIYDATDLCYQDCQQSQVAALRAFYTEPKPRSNPLSTRIFVDEVTTMEIEDKKVRRAAVKALRAAGCVVLSVEGSRVVYC